MEKFAHDHPALAPPEASGYLTPATAQEFATLQQTLLPALDNQMVQDWQRHTWDTLEARRAELPAAQAEQVKDTHDELWEDRLTRQREQEKEPER